MVNQKLAARITTLTQAGETSVSPSIVTKYDTVYLTEIKIQEKTVERIVEKIIRDTIVVERIITEEVTEPIAELNTVKKQTNNKASTDASKRPSSVQFNFSEANREDN